MIYNDQALLLLSLCLSQLFEHVCIHHRFYGLCSFIKRRYEKAKLVGSMRCSHRRILGEWGGQFGIDDRYAVVA